MTKLDANRRSTAMIRKDRSLPSHVLKRSIKIANRNTSVSLEDGFWTALREIAAVQNLRMAELVSRIDKDRHNKNLSSAIRVFVLDHYRVAAANRHQWIAKQRQEPGPPITLGNMRELGGPTERHQRAGHASHLFASPASSPLSTRGGSAPTGKLG